jgi:superfamily II DNA/RNA helicase
MLSQIFEPTSSLPRTVVEEQGHSLFDEQGYVLRKEPEKQKHLFRQLATLKEEVTDFRCIVFFKTRHGVKTMFDRMTSLERMFACEGDGNLRTDRPSENASDEDVLRCHFSGEKRLRFRKFVGQGSCRVSENFASQERTRQQFLKGECNLLLATSIADEGLDFPACNTVILMNGADNDIALHQRIGRVRSDGSAVIFVNEGSEQRLLEQAESNGQNAEAALARWASPMGGCGDIAE